METISSISEAPHSYGPYPKAIRVLVVDAKEQDNNVLIGLADPTGDIKAICYEKNLVPKLQKNKSVLLRNFQKGRSCLIVNKTTQVIPTTPLKDIQPSNLEQAKCLVTPPPPAVVALKDISLSPSGIAAPLLTVCGEVVQDEATHVVGQAAQEVTNIIKQDETTFPVTLWNKASHSPAKTGDKITISHVSPRNDKYLRKLALSTTTDTTVTIHVLPPSTKKGGIVGIEEQNDSLLITIFTDDGALAQYTLSPPKTEALLKGKTVEKTLEDISEEQFVFSVRGSDIESFSLTSTSSTSNPSSSTALKKQ
ncbi:uncharacterized protein [Apostichopus japonicus]|uniref:uncharacterized protein n=1 Tax=Stichopus japonicus TaxID=307972 RepID=UPI003AB2699D